MVATDNASESGRSSATPPARPPLCWSCGKIIADSDAFCRHCGRRQMRGDTWYYRSGWILFLTFFVLGPLTLPLILRSPILTRTEKWLLATVATGYAVLTVYLGYVLLAFYIHHFMEFSRELNDLHL